jgi:hypothetical protein
MRLTGSDDCRISEMRSAAVLVGCDNSGSRTDALNRFWLLAGIQAMMGLTGL